MANLQKAINALNIYQFRQESCYPNNDAQRNLAGRTHYADDSTLKYFKARILRGTHSKNGLYYVMQESLPHPDYDMKRIRRNVVFNVFGSVIGLWRDECHTSNIKADNAFSIALAWCDSAEAESTLLNYLNGHISRLDANIFEAQQALKELA
jgi:hypothetical protein